MAKFRRPYLQGLTQSFPIDLPPSLVCHKWVIDMATLLIPSALRAAEQILRWPKSLGQSPLARKQLVRLSQCGAQIISCVHLDWTRWGSTGLRNGLLIFS